MKLLEIQQMYAADQFAIKGGISGEFLMEQAGAAVAQIVEQSCSGPASILLIAGPGNNGGDAFVAARLLKERAYNVTIFSCCIINKLTGDAKKMAELWESQGGFCGNALDFEVLKAAFSNADLVVDGLFGAGLDRPLTGGLAELVGLVNQSGLSIISIDVPSGIDGDTGQIMGCAIQAYKTCSFFRPKPGHFLSPGKSLTGELIVKDIGIPSRAIDKISPTVTLNCPHIWKDDLPIKQENSHKYHSGALLVIGGSEQMRGAGVLCSNAALRSGAGLVTITREGTDFTPHPNSYSAIMQVSLFADDESRKKRLDWENVLKQHKTNAVLIGPGALPDENTRERTMGILEQDCHCVIDAGALTAFEGHLEGLVKAIALRNASVDKSAEDMQQPVSNRHVILTPHEGEFVRLFGAIHPLGKIKAVKQAAQHSGATIILKGSDTVVATPEGEVVVNGNAPSTLASAGTGDVLAGLTAGLLAQGMPAFKAAAAAVFIHSECGNNLAIEPEDDLGGKRFCNLVADDLIDQIPSIMARLI